jgi:hypothetical protein
MLKKVMDGCPRIWECLIPGYINRGSITPIEQHGARSDSFVLWQLGAACDHEAQPQYEYNARIPTQ